MNAVPAANHRAVDSGAGVGAALLSTGLCDAASCGRLSVRLADGSPSADASLKQEVELR
jgi:hypothetical protein